MPLFEYVCLGCGEHFERYVRSAGEDVTCPTCATHDVEKQHSTFAMSGVSRGSSGGSSGCGSCSKGSCGSCHSH